MDRWRKEKGKCSRIHKTLAIVAAPVTERTCQKHITCIGDGREQLAILLRKLVSFLHVTVYNLFSHQFKWRGC